MVVGTKSRRGQRPILSQEKRAVMGKTKTQQIRSLLPIAKFVSPHTNGLKRSGPRFYIGRCPFHQSEKAPPRKRQFWVNPELGICGCFNPGCDAHGQPMDVINFYARLNHLTNSEAIAQLWKKVSLSANRFEADTENSH